MNAPRNHSHFSFRGQGTTEYLIILAIVIVIALVVVSVLGGFPSFASGITQGQSKSYWGSVVPLAIIDWQSGQATGTLIIQNQGIAAVTITDVNWDGVVVDINDTNVSGGGKASIANAGFTCGVPTGKVYSRTLGYKYNSTNLTGIWVKGATPLVGNCQ